MDNQDSSPQIIFPNVPDDFCPTGNWQEVLQEFIDIVLSNGTINVPGLGDVTPAKIEEIETELQNIQNQVDALNEAIVYTGSWTGIPAGSGLQTFAVVFPAPLASLDYGISLVGEFPVAGLSNTTPLIGIVAGSKSLSGFTIGIEDNGASPHTILTIHWSAMAQVS